MKLVVATVVALLLLPVAASNAAITRGWTRVPDMAGDRSAHAAVAQRHQAEMSAAVPATLEYGPLIFDLD